MNSPHFFDEQAAKKNLAAQEEALRQASEQERLDILEHCSFFLKKRFSGKNIEVYLVGSITRPYQFRKDSDIDIVLKGYTGDRFEIWTELEAALHRSVEIILFESCHFQDHVIRQGIKVI